MPNRLWHNEFVVKQILHKLVKRECCYQKRKIYNRVLYISVGHVYRGVSPNMKLNVRTLGILAVYLSLITLELVVVSALGSG